MAEPLRVLLEPIAEYGRILRGQSARDDSVMLELWSVKITVADLRNVADVADRYTELHEALLHAEAILTYCPQMSTNKGGAGPSTSTNIALNKVRAALAKAEGKEPTK